MKEPGTPHPILQGAERINYEEQAITLLNNNNFDKLFPLINGKEDPQYTQAKERAKTLLMSNVDPEEIIERLKNGFINNNNKNIITPEGINWDDKTNLLENLTQLFIPPDQKNFTEVLKEIKNRYNKVAGYIKSDNKKAQDELIKKISRDVDTIKRHFENRK